ncbi:MAG: YigZ family protein [Erysipelotrichaceae bacterium]|nr:YigZ family protein [Erysipelotrichaceae bacterium]
MYIKDEVSSTLIIEKSRFIAYIKPVFSEDEYKEYLKEIRKKYYDASHVVSAFISNNIKRSSDDGEPSGTGGIPVLNILEKNNLNNTCCLVVRYFGGIKLGVGGLSRAYSNAALEALKKAIIVEDYIYPKYELISDYEVANKLDNLLMNNTYLLNKDYDVNVKITFVLKNESILDKIKEITKGKSPTLIGEEIIQKVIK